MLIAETGGQNAMLVDSSALPEQVVNDAITSAFNAAGQRCSALRVLFVQEDIAPRVLELMAGAMDLLTIGEPALLATDIGPVIDAQSLGSLEQHAAAIVAGGFVLPFGVMETALQGAPGAEQEYIRLAQALDAVSAPCLAPTPDPGNHGDFTAATRRMRELVGQVEVPDAIAAEAKRRFAPTTRLIVRSSANCEDAEEYAGAGPHESVIGVPPSDITSAIRTVWASLWTERATLSRRNAGIPHAGAHMAVLIQELVVPELSFVLHTVNPISQPCGGIC